MKLQKSILQELSAIKPELSRRFFVDKIGLFGSVTRDDFSENSDIDVIVAFTKPVGLEFIDLADFLEEKFKRKVDLVSLTGLKKHYFEAIKNKIIYV